MLGVWPLHHICGTWGGVTGGIFGQKALGGLGEVSFVSQLVGSVLTVGIAFVAGYTVWELLDVSMRIRLTEEEELKGSDLTIHKLESYPEEVTSRFN